MKKTILKKTITMLLALTLIFSLSANAFAASVTWMKGGIKHTATVTVSGTIKTEQVIPGTTVSHTYGTATTVYCMGTKTTYAYYLGSDYCSTYVDQAASSAGMTTRSISATETYSASFTVSASTASGDVAAAIYCYYKYGPWSVEAENISITSYAMPGGGGSNLPNTIMGSGTIYAPMAFYSPEIAHVYYY